MRCGFAILFGRNEGAAAPTAKRAPIFAEAAQIHTVDTLEGLACTHEASGAL